MTDVIAFIINPASVIFEDIGVTTRCIDLDFVKWQFPDHQFLNIDNRILLGN